VLFIYNGYGWKKKTYSRALTDIKRCIGEDHVLNLNEFEAWLLAHMTENECC
jgi:hypothetical protein